MSSGGVPRWIARRTVHFIRGPDMRSSAHAPNILGFRNGAVTPFDASKIGVALTKAFLGVEGSIAAASRRVHEAVEELTREIVTNLTRRAEAGRTFHIEEAQDQVELALMRGGHHKVARAYVLYREQRAAERAQAVPAVAPESPALHVMLEDGARTALDMSRLRTLVSEACQDLSDVSPEAILSETMRNLYDGITKAELAQAPVMAPRTLVEREPDYAYASARLLLDSLRREALSAVHGRRQQATQGEMADRYAKYFPA